MPLYLIERKIKSMANIMINNNCNLTCPYCFANEYVNKNGVKNITLEDFKTALTFIKTGDSTRIGLIGGEPLLHPEFKEILNILVKDNRVKEVVIFTNGILLDKYIMDILHPKVFLLVNANSPETMGLSNYNKMVDNLDKLYNNYKLGRNITIGLNMYRECKDYSYIYDIINITKADKLRASITVPNSEDSRHVDVISYFKEMVPVATEIFKNVFNQGAIPFLDCNYLPPCTVSEDEFEVLKNIVQYTLGKEELAESNLLRKPDCAPIIDINYDLKAVRCFGLSSVGEIPIVWFENIADLYSYFDNQFDSLSYNILSSEDCRNCSDRLLKKCTGGCLAYKADKIANAVQMLNNL